jgi:hypothetical protein
MMVRIRLPAELRVAENDISITQIWARGVCLIHIVESTVIGDAEASITLGAMLFGVAICR